MTIVEEMQSDADETNLAHRPDQESEPIVQLRKLFLIALGIVGAASALYSAFLLWQIISGSLERVVKTHLPSNSWARMKWAIPFVWIGVFVLIRRFLSLIGAIDPNDWTKAESRFESALSVILPASLAAAIGLAFACWFPHYLFWPWWMDLEHFAVSAQMWDDGIRPYRDLIDFNFPGPTYVMWLFDKVFGWGRPMVANAVDGMIVLAMCLFLSFWSLKRLGSYSPGLFAALLIIRYYFSLDYSRVMQRDWYVACLGVAAICLVQTPRFRFRWLAAGALLAVAGCIRPYAILAVPPTLVAFWAETEGGRREKLLEILRLVSVMAIGTILLWLPLVAHGIFDDFANTFLAEARKGGYKSDKHESLSQLLLRQIETRILVTAFVGMAAGLLVRRHDPARFGLIATWFVALAAMLFYMPMCPVRHDYTAIPVETFAGVGCGIGLWVLLDEKRCAASLKILVVAVWFLFQFPGLPEFCRARASAGAVVDLIRWRTPDRPPPGCQTALPPRAKFAKARYCWEDYQATLGFIRERTTPETRVVNFLWQYPFPALNGPTGRKILFPCAEGFLWLRSVNRELEPRFAAALDSDVPAIVVTHVDSLSKRQACPYPIIDATIRERFELSATIGNFEIHVRKPKNEILHGKSANASSFDAVSQNACTSVRNE
jgi:hypothetical protein